MLRLKLKSIAGKGAPDDETNVSCGRKAAVQVFHNITVDVTWALLCLRWQTPELSIRHLFQITEKDNNRTMNYSPFVRRFQWLPALVMWKVFPCHNVINTQFLYIIDVHICAFLYPDTCTRGQCLLIALCIIILSCSISEYTKMTFVLILYMQSLYNDHSSTICRAEFISGNLSEEQTHKCS